MFPRDTERVMAGIFAIGVLAIVGAAGYGLYLLVRAVLP